MKNQKHLKQLLATALAVPFMLSTTLPVNAETVLNAAGNASVVVSSNVTSTFEVRIPDSVTLAKDGTNVPIYGSGDIGGDETLHITTDDTLTMSSVGKENVILDLSQDVTAFSCEEVAANCTSTISISAVPDTMSAGNWTGTMNVNVNLISSGAGSEYAEKVALMNSLSLHLAGDSVMEGYGNNYNGVGDYLSSIWGSKVMTDYSISGALMTKYSVNNTSIYKSIGKIADKLNNTYSTTDVVIFDGGGNELMGYDRGDFPDITFDYSGGSTQNDVLTAWATSMGDLLDAMEAQSVEAPIIYLMPYVPQASMYETYRTQILDSMERQTEQGVDNVFVIDLKDVFTDEDYQPDGIHWTDSAYKKLSQKIADVLYDYYSS